MNFGLGSFILDGAISPPPPHTHLKMVFWSLGLDYDQILCNTYTLITKSQNLKVGESGAHSVTFFSKLALAHTLSTAGV